MKLKEKDFFAKVLSMLTVENISFGFNSKTVLQNLSLNVPAEEICCIIGASGSGKTSLFQLIAKTYFPFEGKIIVDGEASYVPQQDLLLPWRSVLTNLLLPLELKKTLSTEKKKEALALLEELGLKGYEKSFPHELSQGMRQRVSLATMLFQKSPLLLLDEPFASLDVALREQLFEMLKRIREKYNTTILMTTHDFRDALSLADRIVLLRNGAIEKEWTITESIRQNPNEQYAVLRRELNS